MKFNNYQAVTAALLFNLHENSVLYLQGYFLHQSSNLINIFISNGNDFLYNDFDIIRRVLF